MAISSHPYFWTQDQIDILEECYSSGGGLFEAQQRLPEKQRTTIAAQASRRGLTKPRPRLNHNSDNNSAGY